MTKFSSFFLDAAKQDFLPNMVNEAGYVAIPERLRNIQAEVFEGRNGNQRAGLIDAAFLIKLLARRYLEPITGLKVECKNDADREILVQWYADYCKAILRIAALAQNSWRRGEFELRDFLSRTPLLMSSLEQWFAKNPAEIEFGLFEVHLSWDDVFGPWPDEIALPPGGLDPDEAESWAVQTGLAKLGEVTALLSKKQPRIAVKASDATSPVLATSDWKMQVQIEAARRLKSLRASGANPSVHSILNDIAKWCSQNGVKTDSGIFPSANYLRTHVLSGKHWVPPF
jgi:hypothetical protein